MKTNSKKMVTKEEQKAIQLNILNEIKQICDEHDICYYLGYGTLLGAIRHKGFIPWDDDIDILMPRNDYNRFLQCADNDLFNLLCLEHQKKYIYAFAKACDKRTVLITEGIRCGIEIGVYVDIFPIDGVGNTIQESKRFMQKTALLYGLYISSNWKKYVKGRSKDLIRNTMRLGCFILSRFVSARTILEKYHAVITKKDFQNCKYVAVCMSPYRTKEILPNSVFGKPVLVMFEGAEYNAPCNYQLYLKSLYGDYMKLPPKEERNAIHRAMVYYK